MKTTGRLYGEDVEAKMWIVDGKNYKPKKIKQPAPVSEKTDGIKTLAPVFKACARKMSLGMIKSCTGIEAD